LSELFLAFVGFPAILGFAALAARGLGGSERLLVWEPIPLGGMLDQRQDPAGHEAGGAHGGSSPGQFAYFDQSTACADINSASSTRRRDFVCTGVPTRIDHNLYSITFHTQYNTLSSRFTPRHDFTEWRRGVFGLAGIGPRTR
jgi:hypothetical protein